jgi:protein-S-isoprenylcysteine O-methyltransferase Ste14
MSYERFFGSGPTGLTATFFIWVAAYFLGEWLGIPPIGMNPTFWLVLLWFFVVDLTSNGDLVSAGSPCWERGKKLVTSGPYRLMRHPLYAAFIWSGTGAAAVWLQSWLLIFL